MRVFRWLGGATLVLGMAAAPVQASPFFPSVRELFRPFAPMAADSATLIDWRTLNDLDIETGKAPPALKALDGKRVKIAAFIVPLEDDMQESDEFLLVPYFGACVHTPPPPANQMVYVKMRGAKSVKIGWWDPVMFEGIIHFKQVESTYGATSYEMEGLDSKPYTPPKKP